MQSRWAIVASHGREDTRRRLRRVTVGSSMPQLGYGRRLSTAYGKTASLRLRSVRELYVNPRAACHFADEATGGRCFHSSPSCRSSRPIHTSFPRTAPVSAIAVSEQDDEEGTGSFDAVRMERHIFDDTPPTVGEHEPWSSSANSLNYDIDEASLWDEAFDDESLTEDVPKTIIREPPVPVSKHSAYRLLQAFDPENPPGKDNLEAMQLWLEVQAQQESVAKYEKLVNDAHDRKDFASLGVVQKQVLKWYQALKEEIEEEQRRYFLEKLVDIPKGLRIYGPYLCSLQPEKLAVITAHVALIQSMLRRGDNATVLFLAKKIGSAVECEVNVQSALRKMVDESRKQMQQDWETDGGDDSDPQIEEKEEQNAVDSWVYGPSHLRKFFDDANRSSGKANRKGIHLANRRARKILNVKENWNEGHKVKLGVALLEMLLNTATMDGRGKDEEKAFTYEKRLDVTKSKWGKRQGIICLNEKLYEMLAEGKSKSFAAMTDRYKPMVLPPRDWTSPNDGAYSWLKASLMRTDDCNTQKVS